jgi:hypothetical protein
MDGIRGRPPVGRVFDALRDFSVRGGRVVTPVRDLTRNFLFGFLGREPDAGGARLLGGCRRNTFVETRGSSTTATSPSSWGGPSSRAASCARAGSRTPSTCGSLYVGFSAARTDPAASRTGPAHPPRPACRAIGSPPSSMHSEEFSALVAAGGDNSAPTRPDDQLIGDDVLPRGRRPPPSDDDMVVLVCAALHSVPCQVRRQARAVVRALAEGLVDRYFGLLGALTTTNTLVALYERPAYDARGPYAGGLDYWSGLIRAGRPRATRCARPSFNRAGSRRASLRWCAPGALRCRSSSPRTCNRVARRPGRCNRVARRPDAASQRWSGAQLDPGPWPQPRRPG